MYKRQSVRNVFVTTLFPSTQIPFRKSLLLVPWIFFHQDFIQAQVCMFSLFFLHRCTLWTLFCIFFHLTRCLIFWTIYFCGSKFKTNLSSWLCAAPPSPPAARNTVCVYVYSVRVSLILFFLFFYPNRGIPHLCIFLPNSVNPAGVSVKIPIALLSCLSFLSQHSSVRMYQNLTVYWKVEGGCGQRSRWAADMSQGKAGRRC